MVMGYVIIYILYITMFDMLVLYRCSCCWEGDIQWWYICLC